MAVAVNKTLSGARAVAREFIRWGANKAVLRRRPAFTIVNGEGPRDGLSWYAKQAETVESQMPREMESRISSIVDDASLDCTAKVSKLRQLEADVLARQRASTEGMEPSHPHDGEDLKLVERALLSLGENAVDQGPASL